MRAKLCHVCEVAFRGAKTTVVSDLKRRKLVLSVQELGNHQVLLTRMPNREQATLIEVDPPLSWKRIARPKKGKGAT